MKYYDNLIIGAGIGGTYLAARLQKIKPSESILIVDRNSEFGGRLTNTITYDNVAIEMGAIRFYESIHKRVLSLAQKYKLPLIEYLPSENGQIMHLRGISYNVAEVYPNSDQSYNINEDEKGRNPFLLLNKNLNRLIPHTFEIHDFETRLQLVEQNIEFSTKSFQDLAQMNMSHENFQRIMDILGYYDLLKTNTAFMINAIDFLSLSNKSKKQFRFAEGYASLTKKIALHNNITSIKFEDIDMQNTPQITCSFDTEIIKIKKTKHNNWIIKYGYTKINSIEQINNRIKKINKIKVKNIYFTGTIKFLSRIYKFNNQYFNYFTNSFISLNALRIYLRYSSDWMTAKGIGFGKSVTTQNDCQIIHYADKYVMFYVYGSQTNVLRSKIPSRQIQKKLVKPTAETYPLIIECNKILKIMFNVNEDLPPVTDIAWVYWSDPASMYAARNFQTLDNTDTLMSLLDKLMFPFGIDGNFYVVSNEIGLNSGWCEGSLENVDYLCNQKYNQPLFGPDML